MSVRVRDNDDLRLTLRLLVEDLQGFEVSDDLTLEENLEELQIMIRAWGVMG